MADMPEMRGFAMEWLFAEPMPEWVADPQNAEARVLAGMRGEFDKVGGGMQFPLEHEGELRGFIRPKRVAILDDGWRMRVEFDLDDVSLPVYAEPGNPEEDQREP